MSSVRSLIHQRPGGTHSLTEMGAVCPLIHFVDKTSASLLSTHVYFSDHDDKNAQSCLVVQQDGTMDFEVWTEPIVVKAEHAASGDAITVRKKCAGDGSTARARRKRRRTSQCEGAT